MEKIIKSTDHFLVFNTASGETFTLGILDMEK